MWGRREIYFMVYPSPLHFNNRACGRGLLRAGQLSSCRSWRGWVVYSCAPGGWPWWPSGHLLGSHVLSPDKGRQASLGRREARPRGPHCCRGLPRSHGAKGQAQAVVSAADLKEQALPLRACSSSGHPGLVPSSSPPPCLSAAVF